MLIFYLQSKDINLKKYGGMLFSYVEQSSKLINDIKERIHDEVMK